MISKILFNIVVFGLLKAFFVFCGADIPCVAPIIWADVLALVFGPLIITICVRLLINATFTPHQKQEWYRLKEAVENQTDYIAEILARKLFKL